MAARQRRPYKQWTDGEVEFLRLHWWDATPEVLMAGCGGRDMERLRQKAKRMKFKRNRRVPTKHKDVRYDYFAVPTIRNCYWAGAIAADGTIVRRQVRLYQSDREYLQKFADEIDYHGPFTSRESRLTTKPNWFFGVSSERMVADLLRHFSITPKKSLTLQPPQLMDRFHQLAFIGGYIDGDGHIGLRKPRYSHWKSSLRCTIAGTLEMVSWIQSVLGVRETWKIRPYFCDGACRIIKSTAPVYLLTGSGRHVFEALFPIKQIPELSGFLMTRKWDKITCGSI